MIALLVIAILVLLIVVHELGHFIAAKVSKVRVEEFGVGYPPRAFTFGKIGDTEYTLNWIPFGGFVRLFGDEGEGQHGRGALVDSSRWKQAIILAAGVAMNALSAWVLFTVAFHAGVPQPVASAEGLQSVRLMIADIVPGSPADVSGLKPGDRITDISDQYGVSVKELTPGAIAKYVSARGGRPLSITYTHGGKTGKTTVIPANAVIPNAAGRAGLGVALVLVANKSEPWGQAMRDAFLQTIRGFKTVAVDLSALFRSATHGAPNLAGVVGPIGIVGYVGDAAQNGIGSVLALAALISINLALINLIPIPALDGGRLVILAIEAVRRKDAPRLVLKLLNALGLAFIIFLMITVTYNDIAHLLA